MTAKEKLLRQILYKNEQGEFFALPWDTQDESAAYFLAESQLDKKPEGQFGASFKALVSHFEIMDQMRRIYFMEFDLDNHLIGEKAIFRGFVKKKTYKNEFYYNRNKKLFDQKLVTNNPQTPSQFINDFSRAGIRLIWSDFGVSQLINK